MNICWHLLTFGILSQELSDSCAALTAENAASFVKIEDARCKNVSKTRSLTSIRDESASMVAKIAAIRKEKASTDAGCADALTRITKCETDCLTLTHSKVEADRCLEALREVAPSLADAEASLTTVNKQLVVSTQARDSVVEARADKQRVAAEAVNKVNSQLVDVVYSVSSATVLPDIADIACRFVLSSEQLGVLAEARLPAAVDSSILSVIVVTAAANTLQSACCTSSLAGDSLVRLRNSASNNVSKGSHANADTCSSDVSLFTQQLRLHDSPKVLVGEDQRLTGLFLRPAAVSAVAAVLSSTDSSSLSNACVERDIDAPSATTSVSNGTEMASFQVPQIGELKASVSLLQRVFNVAPSIGSEAVECLKALQVLIVA